MKEASLQRVKEEQEEARLGREEAQRLRTAAEKAAALARSDDYRLDDVKHSKDHRLSRKKRRRLEALKAVDEASAEEAASKLIIADNTGQALISCSAEEEHAFNVISKKAKLSHREKEKADKERSLSEYGSKSHKITIQHFQEVDGEDGEDGSGGKKQKLVKQHTKVVRQKIAVGGLDQDMVEWGGSAGSSGGMSKKQIKKAAMEKEFTEFDANKRLRKGGKLGKSSFKSKSKFKRRK